MQSISGSTVQGGDLSAGTQALPVGKIIEVEEFRKDNPKISQIFIWGMKFRKLQRDSILGNLRKIGKFS